MYTQGWLITGWLLIIIGLITRRPLGFVLGAIVLFSAGASYLWDRFCLWKVEYRRIFTPRRAFYGETITFTLEVTNRKMLPLAWIEVMDELPQELVPLRGRIVPSLRQRRQHLVHLFSLRWYERVRRHVTMRCTARGFFALGPARLRSGDVFGLTFRGADIDHVDYLLVYPRVVPLAVLGLPALHPIGDARARRLSAEDPTRVVGVRDYLPGDPLRRIHWKATARAQTLQSKLYEPTTSHRIAVFLNMDTLGRYAEYRGFVRSLLEMVILTAASTVTWAIEERHLTGLFANGYLPQGLRWVRLPLATGDGHLAAMLEALAKVFPTPVMPIGDMMQLEARDLPWGTTAVVITAVTDEPLKAGIHRLREGGHGVVLILVGDDAQEVPDVQNYHVSTARAWHALEGIELTAVESRESGIGS